jgi:hypothetical protein
MRSKNKKSEYVKPGFIDDVYNDHVTISPMFKQNMFLLHEKRRIF